MAETGDLHIQNNQALSRFEAAVDGHTALLEYRLARDLMTLRHTEVPTSIERRGIGSKLAQAALDYARRTNLKVAPLCPFVAAYIRRNPEYLDVVAEKYRSAVASL